MGFVYRNYRCDSCGLEMPDVFQARDEGPPPCPNCDVDMEKGVNTPKIHHAATTRKDEIQRGFAEDYGLSDMNTAGREGEAAAKAPPPPSNADKEKFMQAVSESTQQTAGVALNETQKKMAENFWNNPGSAPLPVPQVIGGQNPLAVAAPAAAMARSEGVDPIALLHKAKENIPYQVVGRHKF